jgi:hypothetical protein
VTPASAGGEWDANKWLNEKTERLSVLTDLQALIRIITKEAAAKAREETLREAIEAVEDVPTYFSTKAFKEHAIENLALMLPKTKEPKENVCFGARENLPTPAFQK